MIAEGKIILLQDIQVDFSLPKYKRNKEETIVNTGFVVGGSDSSNRVMIGQNRVAIRDINLDYLEYIYRNEPTLLLKFKIWLYRKLYSQNFDLKKGAKRIPLENLKTFFETVKEGVNELEKNSIDEVLKKYETVLDNAIYNNQTALIEKIKDYSDVLKYELILSTSEFNKYITEEDVVKFFNKASLHDKYKTGLCLTYIKNFVNTYN
jgi:hypothetical protein